MKKLYDAKSFIKLLRQNDYKIKRRKGSHIVFSKDGCLNIIINDKLNPMVAKRLIKENKLMEVAR